MRLIALDTSAEACSAALLVDGEISERYEVAPRRHAELILPMMDALLAEAGLVLSQLDAIAFARGPGAFTGVRIATGVVQGIAFAADLPVVPVSSLAALAQGAHTELGAPHVLVAMDARISEVYWGAYALGDNGLMHSAGTETVCAPERVPRPSGKDWIGFGTGWGTYAAALQAHLGDRVTRWWADRYPRACEVARLGAHGYRSGSAIGVDEALPVYLRDDVATRPRGRT